jgi:galactokinase
VDQATIRKTFIEKFGREPVVVRAPGRINFIGEHTDYNNGLVLPAAINKQMLIAVAPNHTQQCQVYSTDLNEGQSFSINDLQPGKGWANYLQGVMKGIHQIGFPLQGVDVVVSGDIPVGAGLSSSAALCCGFATAYCKAFDIELAKLAIAKIAQFAEHHFAGVMCGLMDQYASLFGEKNKAILLDCQSLEHEVVPFHFPEIDILLIDTKVKHSLADSAYNKRRQACELGAALVMRKNPEVRSLRDISLTMLEEVKNDFPDEIYQRCHYVVEEIARTKKAAQFLKEKNIQSFGKLLYDTHDGLSKEYEVSCEESDFLVDLAKVNEVIGARMMGGGFGGCTINIILKSKTQAFRELVRREYVATFRKEPEFYTVEIEDGVSQIHYP